MPHDITTRYTAQGLLWERTPLWWDAEANKKSGLTQHLGREPVPDRNGVYLRLKDFVVVDLDGDDEGTRHLKPILDAECGMISQSPNGYHYYFPAFSQITKERMTKFNGFGVDVFTGEGQCVYEEPTTYLRDDRPCRYVWLKFPTTLEDLPALPTAVYQWLLSDGRSLRRGETRTAPANGGAGRATVTEENVFVPPTDAPPTLIQQLDTLCGCLTPEWLNSYDNRFLLGMCLKTLSNSDHAKGIYLKHYARRLSGYNDGKRNRKAQEWDRWVPKGRLSMGSLKHWAKKCNPTKYFEDAKKGFWALVKKGTSNAYCEMFHIAMAGDVVYSNVHKCYYLYDDSRTLWIKCSNPARINSLFGEVTTNICYKLLGDIPPSDGSDESDDKRKATLKLVTKTIDYLGGPGITSLVNNFLPAPDFCGTEREEDPAILFNRSPGMLPLLNGVWVFAEKRLIPYERTHFYTYKIPIAYRADADMADINKACSDWFRDDADVIRWVRMWVGYCLTDRTDRQEFLVVYGNVASNGKSVLWGRIVPMLLGFLGDEGTPFFKQLKVKNLDDKAETNPALFALNGKRYAYLSEPNGKWNHMLLKQIASGDEPLNTRTIFGDDITYIPICKIAVGCNEYPEIPQDEGVARRYRCVEMNVRFCKTRQKYAEAPQELKDTGYVRMADNDFITRLLANKEGLMLWALLGASDFNDNPSLDPPAKMEVAEKSAKDATDVVGNWVKNTLVNYKVCPADKRPTEWTTEKVRFTELKRIAKDDGVAINYKDLRKTLVTAGFEVGGRPGKGDECVKFAGLIPDETEENVLVMT